MLRKGSFIFLALAIVLAAAAAFAAHKWIERQGAVAAASRIAMTPVVVAARDLPAGQALGISDLKVNRWPQAGLPHGSFNSVNTIKGRVLKTAASKGEPLLMGKLAAKGLRGGLSAVVPEGYRAMTVKVDEVIGVGGFVQPGDQVDVLVTIAKGPFQKDPLTRTVLQGVKVLTVGENVSQDKNAKPRRDKSKVVTLQVTPLQGETLALASYEGKLILSLRNHADNNEHPSKGVRLTTLLPITTGKDGGKVKMNEKRPSIEIIKGSVRTQQDGLGVIKSSNKTPKTQVAKADAAGGGGADGSGGSVPCYLNKQKK